MVEQNTNMEVVDDMTEVERHEHEKIKRAVSESLLETFLAAESVKQAKSEERGITYFLEMMTKAIPIIIIALVSWVCLTIIDVQKNIALTQKDIVALRVEVVSVGQQLVAHNNQSRDQSMANATIHHVDRGERCNSCHVVVSPGINK